MATESEEMFAHMAPTRLFFKAALPGTLGMLVSSIYGTMDGVFVGQYVGESAFAAINLAMPFVIVNFAFGDLIGIGSAVPISIAHGKGEREKANNIFTCACILNVVTGFVMGLACLLAAPAIMAAMGATGELARQGSLYLRVYAAFLPFTSIGFAVDNYLRICGRIRRSMCTGFLMAASGAAIEFVLLGVCGFGVGAAALSYCVAMLIAVIVAFYPFFRGGMDLQFVRPHFHVELVTEIVRDGTPGFLENVAGRITSIVLNVALLSQGGEDAVSIYGVLMFVDGLVVSLVYGMIDSVQPAVGFNWGAKNLSRVKALEKCCFAATAVFFGLYVAVVQAMPERIVSVFVPNADAAFMEEAVFALRVFASAGLVRWLSFAIQGFMIAVGQSRMASLITVGQALVFPLVVLTVLWHMGITGLWLNMPASSVLAAIVSLAVIVRFNATIHERMQKA